MNWIAPTGLGNSGRVYAVIDPDKSVTEIHEENNMGFVPIRESGATGVEEERLATLPELFALQQNYPNPFNPTTVILYDLHERSHVTLTVFDLLGRSVATLVNAAENAGRHHAIFDASHLATGTYFYRLQMGAHSITRKMLLIR